MRKVTKDFKVGAIYCDVPEGRHFPTYLMFIKVDLNIHSTYFKYVGGCDWFRLNNDGLIEFDYSPIMCEVSNEEVSKLQEAGIINLK